MNKQCKGCLKIKNIELFYKNLRMKDGSLNFCKQCFKKTQIVRKDKTPWLFIYQSIYKRCNKPYSTSYGRYGAKGIKCDITKEELKSLWFRDKAFNMDRPSIDRINSKGNYEVSNCRFIELVENSRRNSSYFKTECPRGHSYSGINLIIYNSAKRNGPNRICRTCRDAYQKVYRKRSNSL